MKTNAILFFPPRQFSLAVLLFLLTAISIHAQNLVPNPGFEELLKEPCSCMTDQNMMKEFIKGWCAANEGTSDIISSTAKDHECYASTASTCPYGNGNCSPHNGQTMGLIIASESGGSYREYVANKLTQPLVKGQRYYAEFFLQLTSKSEMSCDNIGISFFTGELKPREGYFIAAEPKIKTSHAIGIDSGWVKVSGSFIADSAYTYIVIGNFAPTEKISYKTRNGKAATPSTNGDVIYFIDDVTVRPMTTKLKASGDTLVVAGATAHLKASGAKNYSWADAEKPKVIIGHDAQFKSLMNKERTFIVYGDNGESISITVGVIHQVPVYIPTLNGRKVKKGRTIEVHHETVTVTVYDDNKVDGDSISLYYGDSCITQHLGLTHKKITFTIPIDKAHPRQLILFAENQGSMPPNTASVSIGDGKQSISLVLSSDMKNCDSVLLVYKEEDD